MSQNFFLYSAKVEPAARWREAFPDGALAELDSLVATARPGDAIWLATAHLRWQELVAKLARSLPECPLVVLSFAPDAAEAMLALEHGARGYCHALSVPTLLREVALVVHHGGLWIGSELMARVVDAARRKLPPSRADVCLDGLSAREREVAHEVAAGLSNKEIAAKLGITERTVKAHLGAIFEKLGVRDRLQLVLRLRVPADLPFPESQ
ncbi:LuxR family transcriptional regulator [Aromatoleum sp.]|uniref:LuxR family transcriptional regulator n=1 Tax=Aromatoleum sp. TaxID=2307007 RepID=UPI002FC7B3FA